MKAYLIAAETVNDQAMFDVYRKEVPATLVPFGGSFIARGGHLTTLEGEWPHPRLVIIEFPTFAAAKDFYHSEEYQRAKAIREGAATAQFTIVEGVALSETSQPPDRVGC